MNKQRTDVRRKVSKTPARKRTKKKAEREAASNAFSLLSSKLLENLSPEQFLALCSTLMEMKDGVVDIFKEVKPEKKQKMHGLIVQFLDQSDQLNLPKKYKAALGELGQRLKQMNLDQPSPAEVNQSVQALPTPQGPSQGLPNKPQVQQALHQHPHHPPGPNGPHPQAGPQQPPHHQPNGPNFQAGPHHPPHPFHPHGPHSNHRPLSHSDSTAAQNSK
ncbi:hypothetical protein [Paenibacillus urinalis]|uniref:hypothetical protein n=1 Tax=Paenibacillus urinalis TaxID=521520 RepID=UPI00195FD171